MSSISRLTPAACNNTIDVAPALANLNFDFSLWKYEAPKEFDGVGSTLSTFRRDEAENGVPHVTARKLGALFESILSPAPNVTRAYGHRASEISRASLVSAQTRSKYGVFSGRAGSDATSIWAAATSGPSAIAVHLLACLLARMWDGPEAVSIWAEIVQRRKEMIHAEMNDNIVQMTTLAAARQDITRLQLAEWDASARSWLRTADTVKTRQQKQLMLIVDNLKGSVNKMSDTYESVISAWKSSLAQMEGLIQGISQQAMSGDVLLALSAWHLFPDMLVVQPSKTQVHQHDQIFTAGGVLTIGLENPDLEHNGTYWSLPLASLRYYGAPVVSSCSMNSSERSRISLTELLQAFLGCFLQGWGEAGLDTSSAAGWLSLVSGILDDAASAGSSEAKAMISGDAQFSWLNLLLSAAKYYLNTTGNEKLTAMKLVSLGRKHGKAFLGLPKAPMFGMLHRGCFVSLLQTEEVRITFLRDVAKDICRELRLQDDQIFIRYRHECPGTSKAVHEYTTAVPWKRRSVKRKVDQSEHESEVHHRWLYAGSSDLRRDRLYDQRYVQRRDAILGPRNSKFAYPMDDGEADFDDYVSAHAWWRDVHGRHFGDPECFDSAEYLLIQQDFEKRVKICSSQGEEVTKRESEQIEDSTANDTGILWDRMGRSRTGSYQTPWYKFLYGDPDKAAIFVLEGEGRLIDLIRPVKTESHDMYSLFESTKMTTMDPSAVVGQLARHFQTAEVEADPYMQSAKAVSSAAMIYRNFPDATIDIRVLQCKLWKARWVKEAVSQMFRSHVLLTTTQDTPPSLQPYQLDRACAFACITMFESGHYDANPHELDNVMAMSSGDSIYVGAALLCAPSRDSFSAVIKRVAGNIGRPGIAFLVPPVDPLMREVSINEWPQLGKFDFDGVVKDCFKSTSLHLSFTGANFPVNLGFSGAQDADVYMLETLISVHDRGKWIADLNILNTFRSNYLQLIPMCVDRSHDGDTPPATYQFTSIDNWLELVDGLEQLIYLVRAHGNWEARLAACSISVAKMYFTIVTPEKICWECIGNTLSAPQSLPPVIYIS